MSDERERIVTVSVLESTLKSALGDLENSLEQRLTDRLEQRLTDRLEQRITDRLEKRITEEGETTRRHFDVMVEKVNDSLRLVAEVTAHHSTVLDDTKRACRTSKDAEAEAKHVFRLTTFAKAPRRHQQARRERRRRTATY